MIWELKLFWSFWGLKWITMSHMHPDSYLNIGPRKKLKRQKSGKDSQLQIALLYESYNMSRLYNDYSIIGSLKPAAANNYDKL